MSLEHLSIKSKKTVSSWQRKEAEGTPQKQLPTPTTPMILRIWQIHPPKQKPYCIVWNELPQALVSMSMHTKQYMYFHQTGDISELNGSFLKLVDKFTYLRSSVSSSETNIDTRLTKAWTATIGYRSYGSQTWPIEWNAVSFKQRSCRCCYMDALHGR